MAIALLRQRTLAVPELLKGSHFPSLDGYRGIAIILVVISHSFNEILEPFNGAYGVYIFFGISGFLITTLLLKEKLKNGFVSLKQFYIRRCLRIFPVAYLYIVVVLIANLLFNLGVTADSFISAALYVQNTSLFNSPQDYFRHYWSLSSEEQFYLIFPLFIVRKPMFYVGLVAVLLLIAPVVAYLDVTGMVKSFPFHIFNQVLVYMPAMLVGSAFSVLMFYNIIIVPGVIPYRSPVVLVLLIVGGYLIANPGVLGSTAISFYISYFLIAVMLILSLAPGTDFMFRFLNSKVLTVIGVYSYSIYIWQEVFTTIRPWQNLFPGAGSLWANLPVLALVSYASYNFYEKKFLKLKDRFK